MRKYRKLYIVYDTLDNECIVFYGSCNEVANYFNTSKETIQCSACRGNLRKGRYRIESIEVEDEN